MSDYIGKTYWAGRRPVRGELKCAPFKLRLKKAKVKTIWGMILEREGDLPPEVQQIKVTRFKSLFAK